MMAKEQVNENSLVFNGIYLIIPLLSCHEKSKRR
jgi:hypothetical protein